MERYRFTFGTVCDWALPPSTIPSSLFLPSNPPPLSSTLFPSTTLFRSTITDAYGTCSGSPSFTCNLGTVAPGTPKSITVTYTVPASTPAGPQTNSATVSSPTDATDSTATDTNTVNTSADVSVTKTGPSTAI